MRRAIVAVALVGLLLTGCAGRDGLDVDYSSVTAYTEGEYPEIQPEWKALDWRVVWHPITSEQGVHVYRQVAADPLLSDAVIGSATDLVRKHLTSVAFSVPNPETGVCDVYAPIPTKDLDDSMTVLGHEVLHCFMGQWHGRKVPMTGHLAATLKGRIEHHLATVQEMPPDPRL